MFYSSICEIWENLIETYSMKKDSGACYDIESKIFNSRQGTLSITKYYGTLNGLWIELDQYQRLKMCKVQILGKEKLSSLFEVFLLYGVKRLDDRSCLINDALMMRYWPSRSQQRQSRDDLDRDTLARSRLSGD
ncbi:hypothetical protein CR513_07627, partial [Mucuna pruriens]